MKKKCSKACINGNPYRGYLCQCNKCKGKAHGAMKIDWKFIEMIVDCKLLDPTLGKAEAPRYEALMNTILAYGGRKLRRVA